MALSLSRNHLITASTTTQHFKKLIYLWRQNELASEPIDSYFIVSRCVVSIQANRGMHFTESQQWGLKFLHSPSGSVVRSRWAEGWIKGWTVNCFAWLRRDRRGDEDWWDLNVSPFSSFFLLMWKWTVEISASSAYECLDRGSQQDATLATLPEGPKVWCDVKLEFVQGEEWFSSSVSRLVSKSPDFPLTKPRFDQAGWLAMPPPSHNSDWVQLGICFSLGRIFGIAR